MIIGVHQLLQAIEMWNRDTTQIIDQLIDWLKFFSLLNKSQKILTEVKFKNNLGYNLICRGSFSIFKCMIDAVKITLRALEKKFNCKTAKASSRYRLQKI